MSIHSEFKAAFESLDAAKFSKLLAENPEFRAMIDQPIFPFDAQPLAWMAGRPGTGEFIRILVENGADPNERTKWWAGGFSPLDFALPENVPALLHAGAEFDVHSAAKHGEAQILRRLLAADPASVNAPGGDGQRPLHVAANAEIVRILVEAGADLEQRDVDHESTPIQYLAGREDCLRALLAAGAVPDVFTAVLLDDPELLASVPEPWESRVGEAPFKTTKSDGGHIYDYVLKGARTPEEVAFKQRKSAVLAAVHDRLSPEGKVAAAAIRGDRADFDLQLKQIFDPANPDTFKKLVDLGGVEAGRWLIDIGFRPQYLKPTATPLHVACWEGRLELVELLAPITPLDLPDPDFGSPPLGWALHGANYCRAEGAYYVGVVRALLAAGADVRAAVNSSGATMLEQCGTREDLKELLRASA